MKRSSDSWIIRKLKGDKDFNPFSDGFNFEIICQQIFKALGEEPNNVNKVDCLTGLSTRYFNSFYTDYYRVSEEAIKNSNALPSDLIEYLISTVNRNFYLVNQRINDYRSSQNIFYFNDYLKYSISTSFLNERRQTKADAAVENEIDCLNIALSYLRYFQDESTKLKGESTISLRSEKELEESELIDVIRKISILSNLYCNVKESYDTAVWEEGYVLVDKAKKKILIRFKNADYPIILQIGTLRLQQNNFHFAISARQLIESDSSSRRSWFNYIKSFVTFKKLKYVESQDGVISYKLSKGEDSSYLTGAFSFFYSVRAYYEFIGDRSLPNLTNLSLNNLLILFFEIKYLASKVIESRIEIRGINNVSDLKKFSYRIEIRKLKAYLSARTKFSGKQISEFISLLEHKNGRYDLWKKPLVKQGDYYIFPILVLYAPQILYFIDEWLEESGFSLTERGNIFEDYIKEILTEEIKRRNFIFNIPSRKKFFVEGANGEEIDLILITKNSILIGEVKCIKFSMNARSRHNAISKLREGAIQVNRKTKYLLDNKEAFKSELGNIENKEVIKVVITNYPTFTGLILEDVPIIDFFLLHAYVQSGELIQKAKVSSQLGKMSISVDKGSEAIKFYTNEDEFSSNLKAFLNNPPAIRTLFSSFKLKDYKMTLDNAEFQMYIQVAETAETINI